MIPLLPMDMLLLSIRARCYEASGCIPSSAVVLGFLCSFCFDLPILTMRLYQLRPRVVRLDAASWGLHLIAWIHRVLGAVAVVPWNPKNQKNRSCLPPTWTKEELGKRSSIERFFGRVFLFFHLQRPPLCGWSEMASQVALTYAASVIVGLAA